MSEPWEAIRPRLSEEELQERARVDDGKYRQWNPYEHRHVEAMPEGGRAEIDIRKFENYSMDPANENNRGKWQAWEQLGYDVTDPGERRELAVRMRMFVRHMAKFSEVEEKQQGPWGTRYRIPMEVKGPPGSDKTGTLVTVWQQQDSESPPRLITNWLKVHKEDEDK